MTNLQIKNRILPSAEDADFLYSLSPLVCAEELTVSSAEHRTGASLLEDIMFKKGHPNYNLTGKGQFKKGHPASKTAIKKSEHRSLKTEFKKGHYMPKGKKHPGWKGGKHWHSAHGYILIYKSDHPFHTKAGYVYEHRLVMEKMIGRYLKSYERVHHKNSIRYDNQPKNLILFFGNKNWHPKTCPQCGFKFLIK